MADEAACYGPEVGCILAGQFAVMAMIRVGQNRIYTPYMTVYMVIILPNISYTHRYGSGQP
jgi:uncharacterized membrane protein YccC